MSNWICVLPPETCPCICCQYERLLIKHRTLGALLARSRRGHAGESDYQCEMLCEEDGACTCGADDWNARVDAALGNSACPRCGRDSHATALCSTCVAAQSGI